MAVARKNLALAINVAEPIRNFDGHATRESHVALEIEQALAGHVHRDQRSGARGLHINAGSAQIELITDARGQHVLVVAGLLELKEARGFKEAAIGEQIVDQVGVHARSGKDADGSVKAVGRMSGVFESFPGALQEMAVLGIHDGCVFRAQAEEGGIEHGNIVEQRR